MLSSPMKRRLGVDRPLARIITAAGPGSTSFASLRVTRHQRTEMAGLPCLEAQFSEKSKTCCQRFRSALREACSQAADWRKNPIKSSASALRPTRIHTMTVLPGSAAISPSQPCAGPSTRAFADCGTAVTISFDGVHRGHQAMLEVVCQAAVSASCYRRPDLRSIAGVLRAGCGETSPTRLRRLRDKLLCIWAVGSPTSSCCVSTQQWRR